MSRTTFLDICDVACTLSGALISDKGAAALISSKALADLSLLNMNVAVLVVVVVVVVATPTGRTG